MCLIFVCSCDRSFLWFIIINARAHTHTTGAWIIKEQSHFHVYATSSSYVRKLLELSEEDWATGFWFIHLGHANFKLSCVRNTKETSTYLKGLDSWSDYLYYLKAKEIQFTIDCIYFIFIHIGLTYKKLIVTFKVALQMVIIASYSG